MRSSRAIIRIVHNGRPLLQRPYSRTLSSSSSSSPLIENLKNTMLSRPPKFIPDYLLPMPSHLLTTTLNDLISPSSSRTNPSSQSSPKISSPPALLQPAHHLVYFPIQSPPSALHTDGADPDHSPGDPFTRRMWAGGEVFFKPGWEEDYVLDGREWLCRESIDDVRVKGEEGAEKVYVDVVRRYGMGHEVQDGMWGIAERRTLVFMRSGDGGAGDEKSEALPKRILKYPHQPTSSATLTPSSAHLFHFSALTFNAHEIHLNPLYARSTDGHRDLLVHGPLTLALMMHVLNDTLQRAGAELLPLKVTYRNHAPLYVGEQMRVCVRRLEKGEGRTWDVWVEGPEGGMAVKGRVELRSTSEEGDGYDAGAVSLMDSLFLAGESVIGDL